MKKPLHFDDFYARYCEASDDFSAGDPGERARALLFLAYLYAHADRFFGSWTEQRIAAALENLISSRGSFLAESVFLPGPGVILKLRFASSIDMLLRRFLGQLTFSRDGPIGALRYMWWDIFPMPTAELVSAERTLLTNVFVRVMERSLYHSSVDLIESGLHGLGHWYDEAPSSVTSVVDRFLSARGDEIPQRLLRLAHDARLGAVR